MVTKVRFVGLIASTATGQSLTSGSPKAKPIVATARKESSKNCAGQTERSEKSRYDGHCLERTEPHEGVKPVVRFRKPLDGEVITEDQVRGKLVFSEC